MTINSPITPKTLSWFFVVLITFEVDLLYSDVMHPS